MLITLKVNTHIDNLWTQNGISDGEIHSQSRANLMLRINNLLNSAHVRYVVLKS